MGKWLWSILLLALLSLLLTCVGPYNSYSKNITESIQGTLAAENISGINVEMKGTEAILTGDVASEAAAERAVAVATSAKCIGDSCGVCKKDRACHTVKNGLNVVAPVAAAAAVPAVVEAVEPVATPVQGLVEQSPYLLTARKYEDGRVVLNGYLPNEDARTALLADANAKFTTVIDDKLRLASGAPANWSAVAATKLAELQTLNHGAVVMEDSEVLITGIADSVGTREVINLASANILDGYNGSANVHVSDAATALVGRVSSQIACQTMFDVLKGNSKVQFASAKADLRGGPTYDLLNRLGSAAGQCDNYGITVEGHTDSDGAEDYNQWLSEARATSVVEYLITKGVSASQIKAVGKGENEPIASNDTSEGKARNRRTVFVVTQIN